MSKFPIKAATQAALAVALGLMISRAGAQDLPQVEQAQEVQRIHDLQPGAASQSEPSLYPGEEEDTGSQFLLETAPSPRWQWFNLGADAQYFHTSNAYLSTTGKKGAGLLVSTIDGEIDAPAVAVPFGQLYGRAGFRYQWFNYGLGGPGGSVKKLDFNAATTYLEGEWQLPDNWQVIGNLSYARLLSDGHGYDEFYKELVPSFRVKKEIPLRPNVDLSVEYSANYRFTDVVPAPGQTRGCNNRTDQSVEFALVWQCARQVDIRPFYNFQYSYYPDYLSGQSRNDYLHTVGVYADYCFNSWSSIRVFLDYEARSSDSAAVPDYRKLDAGGGISATFKF